ncbi:uncharacterized protein CANTADRAFT_52408 [Suhomyces tanzawaensis NRRL Y-17324]|uniref:Autophagy protein 5 n=1 Tax=Suhomyces tanzawaensis NRRL Y-17324 TaxID=984487 RepID=A0A1E4SJ10_9ASCO|nr:uncharacterized protein CANTADRAFT_52408 [Suhomyces tanzawaensis NRRL Y-17324]ODV79495.1 hypothetical protein CANTADRAFT_52408 [Suhomyces tanzawaensis NRRL Y-17324]
MQSIEVKESVWNGLVNVRIVFRSAGGPVQYLARVYRQSYFAVEFAALVEYFGRHDKAVATQPVWLEYESVPIKWNLPVGVLHDYLHLPVRTTSAVWTLTLRCDQYPRDHIIPFIYTTGSGTVDYARSLQETVVNLLKQSSFVLNGNAKVIMALGEADSNAWWHAIVAHNLYQYERVARIVMPSLKFQRVPVKVYVCGSTEVIQAPIYPTSASGAAVSLGAVLSEVLPSLFAQGTFARPYIQGLDMTAWVNNPDCGILDLWKAFKHLDNFLYITVLVASGLAEIDSRDKQSISGS